jgi:nicotinate phosphoribosyltransferase
MENTALINDIYQIFMANGYYKEGITSKEVVFDLFFRNIPEKSGFVIAAGLETIINEISNFKFSNSDLEYLKEKFNFCDEFIEYLRNFKFNGDIYAVPEGTPIFPNEPILTVKAPIIEAHMIENVILRSIYYESLIATKANRLKRAANHKEVYEFSNRFVHTEKSALLTSRAAFIGGIDGTSNILANKEYKIPVIGAMTHSYILMFDDELTAFKRYARENPDDCVLIVDTYDSLKKGIPNAIKTFNEELLPLGKRPKGILIGSGDITYISKKARVMLDDAGFPDCNIIAANSLDEYLIRDLIIQGTKADSFGIGQRLISESGDSTATIVYKPVAVISDEKEKNLIKISQNANKITTPGFKTVYRFFDRDTGKALADVVSFTDEEINENEPFEIFDPEYLWKTKVLDNFVVRRLLKPVFKAGKPIYKLPSLENIRKYCKNQTDTLWEEILRFEKPHKYYVDLSKRVWTEREKLLSTQFNYKGDFRR